MSGGRCPLCLLALVAAAGCHEVRPPESAATIKASELPADVPALARRAEELFQPADPVSLENTLVVCDRILQLDPRNYDAAWQWARSAFWLADAAGSKKDRRAWFAGKGAEHAARAIAIDTARVEGHYYRGLDLGYLARTRTFGAVELVTPIFKEAQAAVAADEKYDHAGPLRLLGGVLINAPGWPASVGDPDEGADRLARAVALAPDYPLNHLYYGEALIKVGKLAEAEEQLLEAQRLVAVPEHAWMQPRVQAEVDEQLARLRAKRAE
jgi:tetratricopeptide (TPR) repeat protein